MQYLALIILVIAAGFVPSAANADGGCTTLMQKEATLAELDFKDWQTFYGFYSKYISCGDDGIVGEGYSDSVVKLLANQWIQIETLEGIIKKHPDFREFVLSHIDATTDADDLDKVISLSDKKCPASEQALCKDIYYKATAARQEMRKDTGY